MTTVALFGGSFNPPHVAHQLVALYVLETQPIDELWLVPTFAHAFGKELAAYDQRVAMCELAAAPLGARVRVSRAEQELAANPDFVASRTLDLIEHLERPGVQFRLVVGSDILGETAQWHRWDEIARRAPPIVVSRPGRPGGTGVAIDVSSTRVRELLAARDPAVSALVPRAVLSYIAGHGLYDRA
ncbi:MAG TPA: nicotinate-nicotinamide nucleotide adenylyltransferase [Kofleriaceae bacterium]|jgi:nicotinate-nucleotide adenylyltransferase